MSIKGFKFDGVVHKYDYNSLDNIPDLNTETDKTLAIDGVPADAKATGDRISNLQSLVGSPLTASTAASMTDTNKVYVYTGSETGYTNGNWYYHDGTSWVSGGVYNSVAVDLDSTLTLANKAPDSKVVGDAISSLNEDITNKADAISTNSNEANTFSASTLAGYGDNYKINCDATGYDSVAIAFAEDFCPVTDAGESGVFSKTAKNTVTINGTISADTVYYTKVDAVSTYAPLKTINNGDTVNISVYIDGEISGSATRNSRLELYLVDANNSHQFLSIDLEGSGLRTATFTANRDVVNIRVYFRLYTGFTFNNVEVSWGCTVGNVVFNSVNVINDFISFSAEEIGDNGFSIFPPTAYVKRIISIEEYVNSHVPVNMLTKEDLVYVTPEFFGALGNGGGDDTVAIQNCIDYAISHGNLPVKMFGKYKTANTVYINSDNLNLYCRDWNNETSNPVIILTGSYNCIEIDYLRGTGDLFTVKSTDTEETNFNVIKLGYCYSRQARCIVLTATVSDRMYGNEFHAKRLKANTNCIYCDTYSGGEHVFIGNGCSLVSGSWAIVAGSETNTYRNFLMESYTEKGVYASAGKGGKFYNIRTVEMLDKISQDTSETGLFAKGAGVGYIKLVDTYMDYVGIDISECLSFNELQQSSNTADIRRFPFHKNPINRYGDAGTPLEDGTIPGVQCFVPKGTSMIVCFNKKYIVPEEDFIYNFSQDITIPNCGIKDTQQKILPTIFNITDNCEIILCESYNPLAANEITVIQPEDKSVKIFDHNENIIFDGTVNHGNFKLKCVIVPNPFSEGASSFTFENMYLGFNERWIIEKI